MKHQHQWQYMEWGPIMANPSWDNNPGIKRLIRFVCECGVTKLVKHKGETDEA